MNFQNDKTFVSRGGIKFQAAIENWKLKIENLTCLDVGSSTGGFVDCLLQNGAKKVYALDTSYGELAWKLRNDPRVVVMERTNILHLESLPEPVDLITIDAGWTKLELILPIIKKFLKKNGIIIALLKPHYETQGLLLRNKADKKILVKGVVPESLVEEIKDSVKQKIYDLPPEEGCVGFKIEEEMKSPILGGAGNQEYLLKITADK